MIERTGPKLTWDSEAAVAIRSLPPGEATDQLTHFENLYHQWTGRQVDADSGLITGRRWFTRYRLFRLRLAGFPVRIFRAEIATLAGALRDQINNQRAEAIRRDFYQKYLAMVEDHRNMRLFLRENFSEELMLAEHLNEPLDKLIRKLLIELNTARQLERDRRQLEKMGISERGR